MKVEAFEMRPGVTVPRLIIGGWQLSTGHSQAPRPRPEVLEGLLAFVEAGCTTFDGADIYTGVEELYGELIRTAAERHGRVFAETIRVHTKFVPDLDLLPRLTKADVTRIIDRSLKRLGREQLDLVQFHWWDYEIPGYVEAALWLDELRLEGKIRHVGLTNFDAQCVQEMLQAGVEIVSHQVQYSLLDRRPAKAMADLCAEHNITLLTYGSLAGGFLSGRYRNQREPQQPLENRSLDKYKLIIDEAGGWGRFQDLLEVVANIAERRQSTPSLVAIRWVLAQPQVGAVIVGTRSSKHLRENLKVFDLHLSEEDHRAIHQALESLASPSGAVYELERVKAGSHASIMRYNLNRDG